MDRATDDDAKSSSNAASAVKTKEAKLLPIKQAAAADAIMRMNERDVLLVHGPPGAAKATVIIEIVLR